MKTVLRAAGLTAALTALCLAPAIIAATSTAIQGGAAPVAAQEDNGLIWLENHAEAFALAKKENKPVLIDFTGSDWCAACIVMKREVLNTPEFAEFTNENLIPLIVDFPRQKPQSIEQAVENRELAMKYGVQGFPTYLVVTPEGRPLGRIMGYIPGGPQPTIDRLKSFINKR